MSGVGLLAPPGGPHQHVHVAVGPQPPGLRLPRPQRGRLQLRQPGPRRDQDLEEVSAGGWNVDVFAMCIVD